MSEITKEELQRAVTEASERATQNVLQRLGFDTSQPIELQKDMAYLRAQREGSEQVSVWVKRGVMTAALSGLTMMLWMGFKLAIKG